MAKADIILIPFPFTNLSDTKIRPCLVLLEAEFDVTVSSSPLKQVGMTVTQLL